MEKKRNKRTLKRRIKRATSFSAFISVLFLSGVLICIILFAAKGFSAYQTEVVSYSIQQELRSGSAVNMMGISDISQIDKNDQRTKMWLEKINHRAALNEFIPFISVSDKIYIKLEVGDKLLYTNEDEDIPEISNFFKDTEAVKPIIDADNNEIGKITVRVNPQFILDILGPIIGGIIILSLLALMMAKIFSMFLVLPIINPLRQLETKVKAIAEGDQETAANTQIILKKPLREIESLADSTNGIMKKLKGYTDMLESQKDVLENQNTELELQNEALMESKLKIQKQQGQLVQSEKMASVGLLTAAITHEINTPIGAINSNAQLEEMILGILQNHSTIQSDDELSGYFGQLKEANDINLMACSRIIEIIKSLKSFSRLDQADFQEANINEGIKSVLVLTNNLLKRRITVHEDYGDIPLVKCYPGQLNQVVMNIIVNATQAIEGEGELFIKTYLQDRYICIAIRDTGSGIKEEDLNKIFEPGFTTKGVGIGLGLGLYISYNIIQNHKGEISVASELGKGTEFTIKIPIDNDRT